MFASEVICYIIKKRIVVNIILDNKSKTTKRTAEALEELAVKGEGARYRYGVLDCGREIVRSLSRSSAWWALKRARIADLLTCATKLCAVCLGLDCSQIT
jgi:hypothetical protein